MSGDEKNSPSLLIFYDYFYPGFKAGGPIQSLNNLIAVAQKSYSIFVITSAHDLNTSSNYTGIRINEWNIVRLPGCDSDINVWYGDQKNPTLKIVKRLLQQVSPQFMYLNGIFSYRFCLLPLIAIKGLSYKVKVIICPRGMLHHGALSGKPFKKNLYLKLKIISGLLKPVFWHATTREEKEDIIKAFGERQQVQIAGNIPKKYLEIINYPAKQDNRLRLIYLSLIAEKKNLLMAVTLVRMCEHVILDIYGPVKDVSYWKECKKIIDKTPGKINYKGEVMPAEVQETFEKYDASILLTRGENFGHALYESLSAGRPVITSHFTPWVDLQQQKAGWNIDISSDHEGMILLQNLTAMPSTVFNEYCKGAHAMAFKYYNGLNSPHEYKRIFS